MDRLYKSVMLALQCLLIAAVLLEGERIKANMSRQHDVTDVRVVNDGRDPITITGDVAVTGKVAIDGAVEVNGGELKNGITMPVRVRTESY